MTQQNNVYSEGYLDAMHGFESNVEAYVKPSDKALYQQGYEAGKQDISELPSGSQESK